MQNHFRVLADLPHDVERCWSEIRDSILTLAREVVGHSQHIRKQWLSEEADRLIAMKRLAVNRGNKPARSRLRRAFYAQALVNREAYYNGMAEQAELALNYNYMKPIYNAVKLISSKQFGSRCMLQKKSNGDQCKSEEEALLRWAEHNEIVLSHPQSSPCPALDALSKGAVDDSSISITAPSIGKYAITRLKNT